MANLTRLAKPGNNWESRDLHAYNIVVEHQQNTAVFFEVAQLPEPHVPSEMLERAEADDIEDIHVCRTVGAMDLAMAPHPDEESAVDDFTVRLFDLLGYTSRDVASRTRKAIELVVCGISTQAKTDVCLLWRRSDIILLVQEDKRQMEFRGNPEAQLIAEAIAAFQSNNKRRHFDGRPTLDRYLFPGILMVGTTPVFYKILVTRELADAVVSGTYPLSSTIVYSFMPPVPRPHRRYSEGMKPLDNRRVILQCFEAFKKFINSQND